VVSVDENAGSGSADAEFTAVALAIGVLLLFILITLILIRRKRSARKRGAGAPIEPSIETMIRVNNRTRPGLYSAEVDLGQHLGGSSSTDGETGYNQQLQLNNAYEMNQTSETDEFANVISGLHAIASGGKATGASLDAGTLRLATGYFQTPVQVPKPATSYTHSIDVDAEITAHSRLQLTGLSKFGFAHDMQNVVLSKAPGSGAPRSIPGKPQASLFSTEGGLLSGNRIDSSTHIDLGQHLGVSSSTDGEPGYSQQLQLNNAYEMNQTSETDEITKPAAAGAPQYADFEEDAISFTIGTPQQQPVRFALAADNTSAQGAVYDQPLSKDSVMYG